MYVFDTSSFCGIFKFYPKRFPTLWRLFDELIINGKVISVREVYREMESRDKSILEWINKNKAIFYPPTDKEALFVQDIFKAKNGHFQQSVSQTKRLKGGFCADPFIVASAKLKAATVITEESNKPNSSKIPNICQYFEIDCINLEKFMEREDWKF